MRAFSFEFESLETRNLLSESPAPVIYYLPYSGADGNVPIVAPTATHLAWKQGLPLHLNVVSAPFAQQDDPTDGDGDAQAFDPLTGVYDDTSGSSSATNEAEIGRIRSIIRWNFGDSLGDPKLNEFEGFNAAHVYTAEGTYIATVTVVNPDGRVGTRRVQIDIANDAYFNRPIYVAANGDPTLPENQIDISHPTTINRLRLLLNGQYTSPPQSIPGNRKILFKATDTFYLGAEEGETDADTTDGDPNTVPNQNSPGKKDELFQALGIYQDNVVFDSYPEGSGKAKFVRTTPSSSIPLNKRASFHFKDGDDIFLVGGFQRNVVIQNLDIRGRGEDKVDVSSLQWQSAQNAVNRLSFGGNRLRVNGTWYDYGMGCQSDSEIIYNLSGYYNVFRGTVGIDDEVGQSGSVKFQVWADYGSGTFSLIEESGVLTGVPGQSGSKTTEFIDANFGDVKPQRVKLRVIDADGNHNGDHGDWINPEFFREGGEFFKPKGVNSGLISTDFTDWKLVSNVANADFGPSLDGFLMQGNTVAAGSNLAYFFWDSLAADVAIIANTVTATTGGGPIGSDGISRVASFPQPDGSMGATRLLYSKNTFTNQDGAVLRLYTMDYGYVSDNYLHSEANTAIDMSPHYDTESNSVKRLKYLVVARNDMQGDMRIWRNTSNLMFRDNVMRTLQQNAGDPLIKINAGDQDWQAHYPNALKTLYLQHNTIINNFSSGYFLSTDANTGASDVHLTNNFYYAPQQSTSAGGIASIGDSGLGIFKEVHTNLWAIPQAQDANATVAFVAGSPKRASEWNGYSPVQPDDLFVNDGISGNAPLTQTAVVDDSTESGGDRDFNGNVRPRATSGTPGAVAKGTYTFKDIGGSVPSGAVQVDFAGNFVFTGGGNDLKSPKDQVLFGYKTLTGDFDYRMRVFSMAGDMSLLHADANAGLMVRTSTNDNSLSMFIGASWGDGFRATWRDGSGQDEKYAHRLSGQAWRWDQAWVRLRRIGNDVYAYSGWNGRDWEFVAKKTIALGSSVLFGPALAAHNSSSTVNPLTATMWQPEDSSTGGTPNVIVYGDDNVNDTFRVVKNGSAVEVWKGATGSESLWESEPYANLNQLKFETLSGDDVLKVDVSSGNPFPGGGISFEGGSSTDGDTAMIVSTAGNTHTLAEVSGGLTVDTGSLTLTNVEKKSVSISGSTTQVTASTLLHLYSLSIESGTFKMEATTEQIVPHHVLSLASLSITNAGTLDLTTNAMIIRDGGATAMNTIRPWIILGRNVPVGGVADGTWDGKWITSSSAAAQDVIDGSESRTIGYALNSDLPMGQVSGFQGETVSGNDVLVRYTYNGDADLDGICGDNDVSIVGGFYDNGVTTTRNYYNGDFNYDGKVDDTDVSILGGYYAENRPPLDPEDLGGGGGGNMASMAGGGGEEVDGGTSAWDAYIADLAARYGQHFADVFAAGPGVLGG